jgi:hypothetical protein
MRQLTWALMIGILMAVPFTSSAAPLPDDAMPVNLPDVLRLNDGTRVTTPAQWWSKRRPELLDLFTREMYGVMPPRPAHMTFDLLESDAHALGGKATRKQVAICFAGIAAGPRMELLIYLPNRATHPVPMIFGLNFAGNQTVDADPAIHLAVNPMDPAMHKPRGSDAGRWPIDEMLARGYGFATAYSGDIDPDKPDGYPHSVRALYPELQNRGDNFSTIGAWAWAMSRAMDYFQTDHEIDARRVALFGWSRLGKAALWAAATDQRFALLIDSESGAGGAKLFHHNVGENIHRLNTVFPQWFCQNFRKYDGRETTMPFDMHMVVALVAPRPIYSANSDGGFDFVGEFLSLKAAEPVYRLLGKSGLPAEHVPPLDTPVVGYLGYHRRTGHHDVLPFDWKQYLQFCDRRL